MPEFASLPPQSVSLLDLLRAAGRRWLWITAVTLGCAAALFALSYLSEVKYEAKVIAVPRGGQDRSGLLSALAGQFGGIAALAGLNVNETAERAEAVQMLQSQTLARQFLEDNKLLPLIFARNWDVQKSAWRDRPHTLNEGVRIFDGGIRSVVEDRRTGLITVRIVWRDPQQAAAWANELVRQANERLRQRAVARAEKSLDYLEREAKKSDNVEIRQALYRLMEDQFKNLLLANVTEDYSFAVIDPAVAPDRTQPVSPKRGLYLLAGLFIGAMISLMMVYGAASRRNG